jgi:plastocyanin
MSRLPSLGLSKTQVSGAVVAAMIAASIALVALGVLTYLRKTEPLETWLVPYTPTAQYGGIFLYSNVIWGVMWVGLFFALRQRQNVGTLRSWLVFFLASLGVGSGLAMASLDWSQMSTIMQLGGGGGSETTTATTGSEIPVQILEGSSIKGNPSYEPSTAKVSKGDVIAWVNADTAPHTVTSGTGADDPESGKRFDSGSLGKGQKFSIPADNLGTDNFDYYCIVHPFMKGSVTVQ